MNQEFERNEAARKSIRIRTKRMAPLPPLQNESNQVRTNISNTHSEKSPLHQIPAMDTANKISIAHQQPSKVALFEKMIADHTAKNEKPINIKNSYTLKLSDLKCEPLKSPSVVAGSILSRIKPQDVIQVDDPSKSALDDIERRIHIIENHTKFNAAQEKTETPIEGSSRYTKAVRYGEMENLLKGGVSHITSKAGLGYLEKGESEVEIENSTISFKRGVETRSSVSGTMKMVPKTVRPANRTASDTKNAENTIKLMRTALRRQEQNSDALKVPSHDTRVIPEHIRHKPKSSPETRRHIVTPENYQKPLQVNIKHNRKNDNYRGLFRVSFESVCYLKRLVKIKIYESIIQTVVCVGK
jgi:hypothetical protein